MPFLVPLFCHLLVPLWLWQLHLIPRRTVNKTNIFCTDKDKAKIVYVYYLTLSLSSVQHSVYWIITTLITTYTNVHILNKYHYAILFSKGKIEEKICTWKLQVNVLGIFNGLSKCIKQVGQKLAFLFLFDFFSYLLYFFRQSWNKIQSKGFRAWYKFWDIIYHGTIICTSLYYNDKYCSIFPLLFEKD